MVPATSVCVAGKGSDGMTEHGCGQSSCAAGGVGCCATQEKPEVAPKAKAAAPPPSGVDMVKIALGLAFACAISALIVGLVFTVTEPIKLRNLKARENTMIRELLGLGETAEIMEVRRYLSWKSNQLEVVYLTPKRLVRLDDSGKEVATVEVPASMRGGGIGEEEKNAFVLKTLASAGRPDTKYVGRFFAGRDKNELVGYVVEGSTLGFKAHIRFFLALTKTLGIRGVEVVQHEEDPGLGAEIVQKYFKNQFTGRSAESISSINVTRDPMPNEWKAAVEAMGDLSFENWMSKYGEDLAKHPNIYAITGSTISSAALTNGVKRALGNFEKRMKTLEPYL
jgi:Na+-translocating ferredoxin:NAD+ oxidoreductase subunit G